MGATALGGPVAGMAVGMATQDDGSMVPSVEAAKRRIGSQQTTDMPEPIQQLEQARMEVSMLPQEQRQQYEPPILAALMKARRGQV